MRARISANWIHLMSYQTHILVVFNGSIFDVDQLSLARVIDSKAIGEGAKVNPQPWQP
jgi:hypothetical protein